MKELKEYDLPDDLKKMDDEELDLLGVKIREFLIDKVSETGGHLASNLGIVELALAIHRVFDSPRDKIIWDVGHQSYVHKILTGRASGFDKLRMTGGLSGFPKKSESAHDAFDTGHASNSISVACGMARARDIRGDDHEVISVIGDGSLTGGLAYEGLNNIGSSKSKVIVILNDNGMSISKNTGGLAEHLANLRTSSGYYKAKKNVRNVITSLPKIGKSIAGGISGLKEVLKYSLISGGVFFEELGFTYIGPVDGHNIAKLTEALEAAKRATKPVLVHVITKKGKGYTNAERDPNKFHGIAPFDKDTGALKSDPGTSYSEVFGDEMTKLAAVDPAVCAVTAAMETATGLEGFSNSFPERTFDVGIAEGHAVSFAGGLATSGMKPVVAIYSSFLQRAYDQILEDVALQKVPVVFAVDRAGIVGADGETHQGIFDISFLLSVPGMEVLAPSDGKDLREMLRYALSKDTPVAIRYPRGAVSGDDSDCDSDFDGKWKRLSEASDVDIWAAGNMKDKALEAVSLLKEAGIEAGVVEVTKLDSPCAEVIREGVPVVTIEDGIISGGFGERMSRLVRDVDFIENMGWPDSFIEQGSPDDLYRKYGLDAKSISERIKDRIEGKN